jgi:hypothetical protein
VSARWLNALVKARQAQEDVAQYELASAQRRAREAHAARRRASARVDELAETTGPDAMLTGPAFAAAAAALQSAAAASAMAGFAAEQADLGTVHRQDALQRAAIDRDVAEHMQENATAVEAARARQRAQLELDEVAARLHRDRQVSS